MRYAKRVEGLRWGFHAREVSDQGDWWLWQLSVVLVVMFRDQWATARKVPERRGSGLSGRRQRFLWDSIVMLMGVAVIVVGVDVSRGQWATARKSSRVRGGSFGERRQRMVVGVVVLVVVAGGVVVVTVLVAKDRSGASAAVAAIVVTIVGAACSSLEGVKVGSLWPYDPTASTAAGSGMS